MRIMLKLGVNKPFKSDDLADSDYFGSRVSIGGNYAIIGAYQKRQWFVVQSDETLVQHIFLRKMIILKHGLNKLNYYLLILKKRITLGLDFLLIFVVIMLLLGRGRMMLTIYLVQGKIYI